MIGLGGEQRKLSRTMPCALTWAIRSKAVPSTEMGKGSEEIGVGRVQCFLIVRKNNPSHKMSMIEANSY